MKKIVQIFALILVMASCENDIKTNLPAFLGEKDNIAWRASDTKVTANPGGTITINAYKDNELVTLTVPNSVGIHYLGTTTLGVNATYSSSNQQSLLLTKSSIMLSRTRVLYSKLVPLADRVLVKRLEALTKTAGGILLPESNISKANEGQIIAVGPGLKTKSGEVIPITVSVGDKVLLPEYGGIPVKVQGDELFLFRNEEILAKIV
jgi:chaperonin GroES